MHRFFISNGSLLDTYKVSSKTPLFHQLGRVFRAKKGEKIILFIEGGDDTIYEIIDIKKQEIILIKRDVIGKKEIKKNNIILAQAYPNKLTTLEIIIQKIVEIGIAEMVLFNSERSQMHNIPESKQQRMMLIAQEAMEQSGGNKLLSITQGGAPKEIFEKYSDFHHIVADPLGNQSYTSRENTVLWIGPEGGWSEPERYLFRELGFESWKFNNQILRLETATIVGAGILAYGKPL